MSDNNNTWGTGPRRDDEPAGDRSSHSSAPYGEPIEDRPSYSDQHAQPDQRDPYARSGEPGGQTYGHDQHGAAAYGQGQYGGHPGAPAQDLPRGMAITALVLGIIALVLVFTLPPLAVVVGIVALILGIIAMRRANRGTHGGRGMAIAGLVLGVLSAIGGLLISIFLGAIFSMLFQSGSECMELPTQAQQEACMERVINERFGIDN